MMSSSWGGGAPSCPVRLSLVLRGLNEARRSSRGRPPFSLHVMERRGSRSLVSRLMVLWRTGRLARGWRTSSSLPAAVFLFLGQQFFLSSFSLQHFMTSGGKNRAVENSWSGIRDQMLSCYCKGITETKKQDETAQKRSLQPKSNFFSPNILVNSF